VIGAGRRVKRWRTGERVERDVVGCAGGDYAELAQPYSSGSERHSLSLNSARALTQAVRAITVLNPFEHEAHLSMCE
jgi:hypothetical protein